jgi:hypothetical protein
MVKINNMKRNDKQRLFEVMSRLDKTFKPKLNENIENDEPKTEAPSYKAKLEEIVELAKNAYENLPEKDLPAWIQDKIVVAKTHLDDICGYIHTGEEHEETKEEGEYREIDSEEEHLNEPKEETSEVPEDESEEETEGDDKKEKKIKIPVVDIAKVGK